MKFVPVKKIRLPLGVYKQDLIVFVTISTADRQKWFTESPKLADDAATILIETCRERTSSLFAWCIMPDHVHLLVGDENIISFVRAFKGRMIPRARAISPFKKLWQRSFYDHILRSTESIMDIAGYIFENPVRSGLVALPHQYPFVGSEVWPNWRASYS
jgi:putative transposase